MHSDRGNKSVASGKGIDLSNCGKNNLLQTYSRFPSQQTYIKLQQAGPDFDFLKP
jgi:hypothetical protein